MNITREQAKALGRKAEQPVRAPSELLAIFVAGAIANPMNATWGHWKRRRWAKAWKERVALVLLEAKLSGHTFHLTKGSDAKAVYFLANVFNLLDGDGLQAALKPIRDALTECDVISGDAERDGHAFTYDQKIDRQRRGVTIRVSLRTEAP